MKHDFRDSARVRRVSLEEFSNRSAEHFTAMASNGKIAEKTARFRKIANEKIAASSLGGTRVPEVGLESTQPCGHWILSVRGERWASAAFELRSFRKPCLGKGNDRTDVGVLAYGGARRVGSMKLRNAGRNKYLVRYIPKMPINSKIRLSSTHVLCLPFSSWRPRRPSPRPHNLQIFVRRSSGFHFRPRAVVRAFHLNADSRWSTASTSHCRTAWTWRDKGYITQVMTGVAWGQYQDYYFGRWDGKK